MSERLISSDQSDQATAYEELDRELAIAAARKPTHKHLAHTGECHCCGSWVEEPKLFCDRLCADEHAEFELRGLM